MKTTLIAVSGISPAILTETLWALAGESPAVVPDEVVVITTSRGEADIRRDLLGKMDSWNGSTVWESLRRDILELTGAPAKSAALQLSIRVIDLPNPDTGVREPAEDLRDRTHNDEAADFILRTVSSFTESADSRVIASIAGGRKTMGALLYAAMTLVGRESDRVTHVLVSPPYETCRGFFYPEQPVQKLEAFDPVTRATTPISAKAAIIELSDISFVPLRNGFAELNAQKLSFAGLVYRYSQELKSARNQRPEIRLDTKHSTIAIDDVPVRLTGRELLAATFLYLRAKEGKRPFPDTKSAAQAYLSFVADWKKQFPGHSAFDHRDPNTDFTVDDLTKGLSSFRKKLADRGLSHTIPHLAPPRKEVGFDAVIP